MHIQEILAKLDSNIEDAEEDVDEDLDLDASQEEEAGKDQIIHGHQGGGDNDNMFNIYFDCAGWTANLDGFPRYIPFTGTSGVNTNIDTNNYSALLCYQLFITDTLIQLLKEETNNYAAVLKTLEKLGQRRLCRNGRLLPSLKFKVFYSFFCIWEQ